MLVSAHPYLKTYVFPPCSLGTLIRILFLVMAVALPFFATYSTPNFFLTSHLQVNNTQPISYNYNYHITITTNQGLYIYTNLYQTPTSRPPSLTQMDSNSNLKFTLQWPTSPPETVLNTQITLFFTFVLYGVTHFGTAQASVKGYSLSEVSIAGQLSMVDGPGVNPMTSSSLTLLGYDTIAFYNAATQSAAFLKYDYSTVALNLPTDLLEVTLSLNYGGFLAIQDTPSILGQLIWSWIQYFPIFLSFYWVLDAIILFLTQEEIIKRKIVHDPDYLRLIEEENYRRERLRLQ